MKARDWLVYLVAFLLGASVSDFLWHFRFINPTLRNELIIYMQEANSYFLLFGCVWLLLTLFTAASAIYFNRYEWFKNKKAGDVS